MARYECFRNQVVVIVGGTQGIGRACAVKFAKEGARVIVADIKDDAGKALRDEITRGDGWLQYVQADATKPEEMEKLAAVAEEEGGASVLVNCVGGFTHFIPALGLQPEQWDVGMKLNLHSIFYSCTAIARNMKKRGKGSIVNISSIAARTASKVSPIFYSTSKAGVEALSRVLAAELGRDGIRVNSLAPGTTVTSRVRGVYTEEQLQALGERTARGRLAQPEEIAAAVLFLASDDAAHITGATLYVNGGQQIFA